MRRAGPLTLIRRQRGAPAHPHPDPLPEERRRCRAVVRPRGRAGCRQGCYVPACIVDGRGYGVKGRVSLARPGWDRSGRSGRVLFLGILPLVWPS